MANGKAFVVSEAPSAPLREIDLTTGAIRIVGEVSNGGAVLARSADRNTLFLRRDDGDVLYSALDGSFTHRPSGPQPEAFVAVSPDGSYIAAGTTVLDRAFNIVANIGYSDFPGVFDMDDPLLYTIDWTGASGEITAINTQTWREQFSFYAGYSHSGVPRDPAIRLMEITPDGNRMLVRKGAPVGEAVGITRVDLTPNPAIAPTAPAVMPAKPMPFSFGKFSHPGAPLKAFTGTLRFSSDDPAAELPPDTLVELSDGQDADFSATLHTPGYRQLTVTVLETGVTSSRTIYVDGAPPTARVNGAYRSGLPGRDNLYRLEAEFVDGDAIDPTSEQDTDPELVAVAPDGTVYPVSNRVHFQPLPPGVMCTGDCPGLNDSTFGFYPEVAGTYVLRLLSGSVTDRAGNPAAGADLGVVEVEGTFDIATTLQATAPRTAGSRRVASVVTISNSGATAVAGIVNLTLAVVPAEAGNSGEAPLAGTLVDRQQKLRLAPGKSRRIKIRVGLPTDLAAGSYRLVAHVTPSAGMPSIEGSHANNTAAAEPFHIGSSAGVTGREDLVASVNPEVVRLRAGEPLTVAVDLLNTGDGPARGRHTVSIIADGGAGTPNSFVPVIRTVQLAPGATRRLMLRLRTPADVWDADYSLTATVVQV